MLNFISLAILFLSITAAAAWAETAPKPILPVDTRSVDVTVTSSRFEDKRQVEVRAKAEFSNACLAPEETVRALRNRKGELAYTFYGKINDKRLCSNLHQPFEKQFLIDRFEIREEHNLPEISVNGVPAKVTFLESHPGPKGRKYQAN